MTPTARVLHRAVRWYQCLLAGRPTPCRYVPTCSNYALDAFEGHGAVKGGWLTVRRLSRCHPWGRHGWDPVPDPGPTRSADPAAGTVGIGAVDPHSEPGEHRCPI